MEGRKEISGVIIPNTNMAMPFVMLTAVSHLAFKANFHAFSSTKEDPKSMFAFQWKSTICKFGAGEGGGTWNNILAFMCAFNFLLAPKILPHVR